MSVGDYIPPDPASDPSPDDAPEGVSLPETPGEHYGGRVLQRGDKDSEKRWGGSVQSGTGNFVTELQNDLVKLGYWISSPVSVSGMNSDGDFGKNVEGGLVTFQKEHALSPSGKVDSPTVARIKAAVAQTSFQRPGHETPAHGRFYQLPPSGNFGRYGDIKYDDDRIMTDVWGTRKMIGLISKTANEWVAASGAVDKFLIGDISLYDGGPFVPHSSHRDGNGVDLSNGVCCNIKSATFDKEKSLQLAKLLVENGATRILFNCKYVQDKCDEVFALRSHHHHFHVDLKRTRADAHPEEECQGCKKSVYENCDYAGKADRAAGELTA